MGDTDEVVVGVRADTAGLRRELGDLRQVLEGSLGQSGERAGRAIEGSLLRAIRTGKLGFEELRGAGLRALDGIAAAAVKAGTRELLGQAGGGGGLAGSLGALLSGMLGAPGRATGGPVAPGRPYWVGERGPELFVPTAAGRVEASPAAAVAPREVRVAITVHAPAADASGALRQSSRQVARAVRAALNEA